jgi:hypothetical protein
MSTKPESMAFLLIGGILGGRKIEILNSNMREDAILIFNFPHREPLETALSSRDFVPLQRTHIIKGQRFLFNKEQQIIARQRRYNASY